VVWDSARTSYVVRKLVGGFLWTFLFAMGPDFNAELLGGLEDLDFRYMLVSAADTQTFSRFLTLWVSSGYYFTLLDLASTLQCHHTTLLHTEPQDQLEETLVAKAVSEVGRPMEPAMFPMVEMEVSVYFSCIYHLLINSQRVPTLHTGMC
jgi:hypothetical protein